MVATVILPFLRRQYDRADLRAGLCRRAAIASSRAPQGRNDRGFADDPGAARRIFPRHVVGSLGIDGETEGRRDGEKKRLSVPPSPFLSVPPSLRPSVSSSSSGG